ncbi:hypothetical protein GQ53DRAFT_750269 [Thozetella sp. PMI_491]|nr:hypothetical protein GQ53DRAFT_750269 [Thozetella sp. PMI_491]
MFGNLAHLIPVAPPTEPPKDVPPPTPVNFPQCRPVVRPEGNGATGATGATGEPKPDKHLAALLQSIFRPTELTMAHFEALGVHVVPDAAPADLVPDPAYIPDFAAWAALDPDAAHLANESTRRPLNNGNLSPGCQIYLDRRRELTIANSDAFRTVRRVPPPKGKSQARLGNSFEFYRHLDLFSSFWEDTSKPKPSSRRQDEGESKEASGDPEEYKYYRTSSGNQMPSEYRQNITSAFLKLVAYDFGCNVSASRVEPRLYMTYHVPDPSPGSSPRRSSYFSSACSFVFRTPQTREAARAGLVEGPLAAVSARHITSFPPSRPAPSPPTLSGVPAAAPTVTPGDLSGEKDSAIDLARELIAALVTAQHRSRQNQTEKRIGEGEWWATKRRWGGGPGGPIGREVEMQASADTAVGDKDTLPLEAAPAPAPAAPAPQEWAPRRPSARFLPPHPSSSKSSKRLKKSGNLPMYDNYRLVRPPASAWDPKAKYEAIGRAQGVDYDDVFLFSSLFHHIAVMRVRVPDRLLQVLEGAEDSSSVRSWGKLEMQRSRWFDLFKSDDRVAAMELVWSIMAYLMRKVEEAKGQDVDMSNA